MSTDWPTQETSRDRSPAAQSLLRLDSALAVLRIEGADAAALLQGQLCNDVSLLTVGQVQLTAMSTPKGRMFALMHLLRTADAYLAVVAQPLAEPLMKRLKMYILRAKVTVSLQATTVLGLLGAGGRRAGAAAGFGSLPELGQCVLGMDGRILLRWSGEAPRWVLLGPPETLAPIVADALDAPELWTRADILSGVPVVLPETQDAFVPQMANMDRLKGISFTKGCYTGQEIVARLHYLGQLKRRMFLVQGAGTPPAPGSDVQAAGEEQAVGQIACAAAREGGGFVATAVLQLSVAERSDLRVGDQALDAAPTPYAYPG